MKLKCGGVEGGWMQVVDVDINQDDSCPGIWHKITTPRQPLPDKYVSLSTALLKVTLTSSEVASRYTCCFRPKATRISRDKTVA